MNRFIIADPNRCIGCRTCELACSMSHDHDSAISAASFSPRITVIKEGDITVPVMCKQCEDAPCAKACPTGALVRANGFIEIHEEHCIGCKSCVVACPFGAIDIVMKGSKASIIKCDLCVDSNTGPACISVCPTDALSLCDEQQLSALKQKKLLRTVVGDNSHLMG